MPTEKPRVTITMPEDQLRQIEDYRFDNKIRNQTQAILDLLDKGMSVVEGKYKKENATSVEPPTPEALIERNARMIAESLENRRSNTGKISLSKMPNF